MPEKRLQRCREAYETERDRLIREGKERRVRALGFVEASRLGLERVKCAGDGIDFGWKSFDKAIAESKTSDE